MLPVIFRLVSLVVEQMKGLAGLDENGISLFKSEQAIDEVWEAQQHHLECMQDPPDMSLYTWYTVVKTLSQNGV